MSILTVQNLSHGFGDRAILNDVSFRLLKGEHIGLIGANGEGKSTFMNIITRKLQPDEGKIEWAKNVRVGYLDQHAVLARGMTIRDVLKSAFQYLIDMETRIGELYMEMGDATPEQMDDMLAEVGELQETLDSNDFYIIDAKVEEVARGLGILDVGLDRDVADLSGGQRTKVLLAKLLLEKPDILLLDEPTNYLDEIHIEWLKRYLQNYDNAFILISHDIPFLNSVINLVYHMENQDLSRYVGDYDKFMEVYEMKRSQLESAYKRQQAEIADLKDFVARNKARVSTRNMAMSRQKKLDKMDVIELSAERPKPEFRFLQARTSGRLIFDAKDLVIGYDEPLSRPLDLQMERGQKIALVGANGIGKTTLLKSLLGMINPLEGTVERGEFLEIGYFEQEAAVSNNTCIEEIWSEFPSLNQQQVRAMLAKCGLMTKHIESKIAVLSGGEKAKVRLCKLQNNESNLLLLDEPTNHLDVDAKEELKRALKEYKGSILLISHEPEFYQDIVTDVWNCESWTTKVF
ncbi:heme ABC transporter ATP-binding protein [Exiguobacterium sp. SH31]|uniref:ABC-F family ATP-binding cassette domain-containing protein n=1 Tax=unclassified Exiguobacterium TaxID=2644629 RepID=UPI0008B2E308|nr:MULTISPECIES: ABC-F family ATP-binding cassette domain-containing protein [unclassified Exiguobacterium]MCC5892800.1 ABC-F family ATP-binding cassette domain-containing protein [Exiguobacterium sp.]OGX78887.1 heme ABC transporter ATP-binding protein [Exiguobacterium sp. SH31]TCI67660.1 ABC-F family ATP-binding cassette domain-containing protein [Exiguobacterium sp. SH0S7]